MNKQQRQKCVAVAKNVLAHLKLLDITPGTYCEGRMPGDENESYNGDDNASKHIDGMSQNCRVCAVGACFLSYVRVYNKVQLSEFIGGRTGIAAGDSFSMDYSEMANILTNVFTKPQLEMIEAAFENGAVNDDCIANKEDDYAYEDDPFLYDHDEEESVTREEMTAAEQFGEKYDNPNDRLKAIMKNIVANDGEFIPDPKVRKLIAKKREAGEEYTAAKYKIDDLREILEAVS